MADGEYMRLRCAVAGCNEVHKAKSLCVKHYRQQERGGLKEYQPKPCAHCGATFNPRQANSIYCSKYCKVTAWTLAHKDAACFQRERVPRISAVYAGYCSHCSQAFVARRKRAHCSQRCKWAAWYKAHPVSIAPEFRVCNCCGSTFRPPPCATRPTDFCGQECKRKANRQHKNVQKLKRRAAKRGTLAEAVNPLSVFARDGWKCQLCGVDTPKEARGTHRPDAPELDHCIPIAKGGEHTVANTQCLCRACNGSKSDSWCERSALAAAARARG